MHDAAAMLTYLKDFCTEKKKIICVIGYEKELEAVSGVFADMLEDVEFVQDGDE